MPGEQQGLSMHILGSMVAVAITGTFSARAHWRLGHVHKPSLLSLYPGLVIGAAVGLWITLQIPEAVILLALAMLDAWVAYDYGKETSVHKRVPLTAMSGAIGYISGTLGIGGGTMLVPMLRRVVSLREAVGTSAACGMLMAIGAVIFNLILEPVWIELISTQLAFLIGVWIGILLVIPKASGWSAYLHQTLNETSMRLILKGLFYSLSIILFIAATVSLSNN
jgi:uncharacterized membrane protein YfcA